MEVDIKPVSEMSTEQLVEFLGQLNAAYRSGKPLVEDDTYDHVYLAELQKREPEHAFLVNVEPEQDSGTNKVRHKQPMLSTEKAYTQEDISAFVKRVVKSATGLGIAENEIVFRITPKLDGMAGKYEDDILATRGNGLTGNDITHNLKRGVVAVGGANSGVGEIVISNSYFDDNLSDHFSHPRNFVTGAIGSDTLNDLAKEALQDGAIRFVAYSTLECINCTTEELSTDVEALCDKVESACIYPLDGSVIDVMNIEIQEDLGATSHHNNWQIAKKRKGETATAKVTGITWQTGRTGRITPVINIETTNLTGANISNITGHHAGNIKNLNIGIGATIEFVRSGEVIPKLLGVVETGETAEIPDECPVCAATTEFDNDFLVCTGANCTAQVESQLVHFFNILGNVDLFGPRTISVLVENDIHSLAAIYAMNAEDFTKIGFGDKQAENLVAQLLRSRTEEVEDWRFLGAFGVHHLGRGDSRKLLKVYDLDKLNELTSEDLLKVNGFGEITSKDIPKGIAIKWESIKHLLALGFNLKSDEAVDTDSAIAGEYIVFTGAMESSRDDMKANARQLGANVQSSVNKKTTMLVIGAKVGATKIAKAEALGTKVVTEKDYLEMLS
jgi:DNA ligase (NAD+)